MEIPGRLRAVYVPLKAKSPGFRTGTARCAAAYMGPKVCWFPLVPYLTTQVLRDPHGPRTNDRIRLFPTPYGVHMCTGPYDARMDPYDARMGPYDAPTCTFRKGTRTGSYDPFPKISQIR